MANEQAFIRSVEGRETPLHEGEICVYWILEDYTDVFRKDLYELPKQVLEAMQIADVEIIEIK